MEQIPWTVLSKALAAAYDSCSSWTHVGLHAALEHGCQLRINERGHTVLQVPALFGSPAQKFSFYWHDLIFHQLPDLAKWDATGKSTWTETYLKIRDDLHVRSQFPLQGNVLERTALSALSFSYGVPSLVAEEMLNFWSSVCQEQWVVWHQYHATHIQIDEEVEFLWMVGEKEGYQFRVELNDPEKLTFVTAFDATPISWSAANLIVQLSVDDPSSVVFGSCIGHEDVRVRRIAAAHPACPRRVATVLAISGP